MNLKKEKLKKSSLVSSHPIRDIGCRGLQRARDQLCYQSLVLSTGVNFACTIKHKLKEFHYKLSMCVKESQNFQYQVITSFKTPLNFIYTL